MELVFDVALDHKFVRESWRKLSALRSFAPRSHASLTRINVLCPCRPNCTSLPLHYIGEP